MLVKEGEKSENLLVVMGVEEVAVPKEDVGCCVAEGAKEELD